MACDLCGKVTEKPLTVLREQYRTGTVKAACDECRKAADTELWRLRAVARIWTEKKMRQWAGGGERTKPSLPWWKRVFG